MNSNIDRCSKYLEEGQNYILDTRQNIRYVKPGELGQDLHCEICIDIIACKYVNKLMDIIARKDEQIFRRTPKDNVFRNDPIIK